MKKKINILENCIRIKSSSWPLPSGWHDHHIMKSFGLKGWWYAHAKMEKIDWGPRWQQHAVMRNLVEGQGDGNDLAQMHKAPEGWLDSKNI